MILDDAILKIIQSDEVLEPETLRQFDPNISDTDMNRILALATLVKTRGFWENFYLFETIVLALNGRVPDTSKLTGCSPNEIWYALELAKKLHPDYEYAKEVLLYIKSMFNDYGVYVFPPWLDGLDNPYYVKAEYLAAHGPFPLGETAEEIQAAKLLAIQEYIKMKKEY